MASTTLGSCRGNASSAGQAQDDSTATTFVTPLHVEGTALLNAAGDTVVLTGPSLGWHSNWGRFYNSGTIKALKIGQHYRIPKDEFIKFVKSGVQSA